MKFYPSAVVTDENGPIGKISTIDHSKAEVEILLNNGRYLRVPAGAIEQRSDGNLFLPKSIEQRRSSDQTPRPRFSASPSPPASEDVVIPVVHETPSIGKRWVDTGGVQINKKVIEESCRFSQPLSKETVNIERVEINDYIDSPVKPRQEGDVLIIPVMEEVLVVSKKLLLREELRVKVDRVTRNEQIEVSCKKEQIDIQRKQSKPR